MKIKAVLFDFIGTTVLEKGDIIHLAFEKAFHQAGVQFDPEVLNQNRGKDKHEIIGQIISTQHPETSAVSNEIYRRFQRNVEDALPGFSLNPDVLETLDFLKAKNIKTGMGTALTRDLFEKIFNRFPWHQDSFHYIGIAREVGRTRPHPDMIFDMMKSVNVHEGDHFLKVGDTITDVAEGKNANVRTAVLLSGTQTEELLRSAHPDFILNTLNELVNIIG